jgi:tetratricopeptide (TPR) repeat protein
LKIMGEIIKPEQFIKEGQAAYQHKEYQAAAQAFTAAAEGFAAAGEPLAAAEQSNNASVAYLQAGEAEAALRAVDGSDLVFAQAGDAHRQALALGNRAAALEALDRLDEAAASYEASADLLKQLGETDLRATVMQALSALQLRQGRRLEALATMQAGLAGVKHPNVKQRLAKKLLETPFKMMKG